MSKGLRILASFTISAQGNGKTINPVTTSKVSFMRKARSCKIGFNLQERAVARKETRVT